MFKFLREIINHYGLLISQVFPLRMYRIVAFELACREVWVTSSLTLFPYFYHIKKRDGDFYFSSRTNGKEFVSKYKETVTGWPRGISW